jgi:hypothetical protein
MLYGLLRSQTTSSNTVISLPAILQYDPHDFPSANQEIASFEPLHPTRSALIRSTHFSPIAYAGICVCPLLSFGMMLVSATSLLLVVCHPSCRKHLPRRPRMPRTLSLESTTANGLSELPILHVPAGWKPE